VAVIRQRDEPGGEVVLVVNDPNQVYKRGSDELKDSVAQVVADRNHDS
jgi:hypothetical protein